MSEFWCGSSSVAGFAMGARLEAVAVADFKLVKNVGHQRGALQGVMSGEGWTSRFRLSR